MQTIATPPHHSEDEYALVRLLSARSTQQAVAIQARLQELFGNAIWLQQPPSLHVTLMEIICSAKYSDKTRKEHFEGWFAAYNGIVKEFLKTIVPFDIYLTELVVSQRAIIVKSQDSGTLNEVRKSLLARVALPPGTKMPPDITHSTLARFTKSIDLEKARRLTAALPVNIMEPVTAFALVKDLGPPDFNGTPLQAYLVK